MVFVKLIGGKIRDYFCKMQIFYNFSCFCALFFLCHTFLLKRLRWKNKHNIWYFPHLFVTLQPELLKQI